MSNSKLRLYFIEGVEPKTPSLTRFTRQVNHLAKNEIYHRWQQPTPLFFRQLQYAAGVVIILSGVILAAPTDVPAMLFVPASYVFVASGAIAVVCQLTTEPVKKKRVRKNIGKPKNESHGSRSITS